MNSTSNKSDVNDILRLWEARLQRPLQIAKRITPKYKNASVLLIGDMNFMFRDFLPGDVNLTSVGFSTKSLSSLYYKRENDVYIVGNMETIPAILKSREFDYVVISLPYIKYCKKQWLANVVRKCKSKGKILLTFSKEWNEDGIRDITKFCGKIEEIHKFETWWLCVVETE